VDHLQAYQCRSTHEAEVSDLSDIHCPVEVRFLLLLGLHGTVSLIVTDITDSEFYLTIAAIPVTIIILAMASFWTRREIKFGMVFTIVLYFAGMAYFVFKLVRMYQASHAWQYTPVRTSLTIFAVLTVILIVLTIVNACVCMANFDKGLKPFVLKRKIAGEDEKIDRMTELPDLKHGPGPSRMTID